MKIQSSLLVENPLVSIIIPSFNRSETVGEAIDSILNQHCNFEFEIVIGDDSSIDNARTVLQKYQEKYPRNIKLIFHDKNIGLGANWATCVKHCQGKYIANCDNDDYWHNLDKLQLQVDFLESHPEYGVVHTNYRKLSRDTGIVTDVVVSNDTFYMPLQKAIFSGKFRCCNATMMYRTDLLNRYVNLDDFIQFQFTLQDWNTWIILSKYTDFFCLPVSTATFGIETESITRPKSYEKVELRFKKEKECYRYVCDMFPENLTFDEIGYDVYVNGILLNLAYKKWDYLTARKYAKEMVRLQSGGLKVKMASNMVTFYLFSLLKNIKLGI